MVQGQIDSTQRQDEKEKENNRENEIKKTAVHPHHVVYVQAYLKYASRMRRTERAGSYEDALAPVVVVVVLGAVVVVGGVVVDAGALAVRAGARARA